MKAQAEYSRLRARRQFESNNAHNIVIRLDKAGFLQEATGSLECLGIDLGAELLMPHIADFADTDYAPRVARYFAEAMSGTGEPDGIVFPVPSDSASDEVPEPDMGFPLSACRCSQSPGDPLATVDHRKRFNLKLSRMVSDEGEGLGAIGTLRLVEPPRPRIGQDQIASTGDQFTGLADRRCFASALSASIVSRETASVAIFAIDAIRAIFMQYGQDTADEIRWGFARFLEVMMEPHFILARIDDERFGVVLPGWRPGPARDWAKDTLRTFSGLAMPTHGSKPEISASAGIARAELSAEWTIRQGELGLVMARSAGGMQAAICRPQSNFSNGSSIEQVMESVVEWTTDRSGR